MFSQAHLHADDVQIYASGQFTDADRVIEKLNAGMSNIWHPLLLLSTVFALNSSFFYYNLKSNGKERMNANVILFKDKPPASVFLEHKWIELTLKLDWIEFIEKFCSHQFWKGSDPLLSILAKPSGVSTGWNGVPGKFFAGEFSAPDFFFGWAENSSSENFSLGRFFAGSFLA
jgi:hypothetical protein